MRIIDLSIKLIYFLAHGDLVSNEKLCKILNIDFFILNKCIKIAQSWGCDILSTRCNKNFYIQQPLILLNQLKISKYLKIGNVRVLSVVNSTNKFFIKLINSLNSGDVCVAEYQFFGYGRFGRKWFAPFGKNLCFSVYWSLRKEKNSVCLSLMIAIAIAEMLRTLGLYEIKIKWPNDLYFKNKKLAGILIETKYSKYDHNHVIIGIGINCITHRQMLDCNYISLQESGIRIDRNLLIIKLVEKIYLDLITFEKYGFVPFFYRWKTFDYFYNHLVMLLTYNKMIVKGTAYGINHNGCFLLKIREKIYSYCDDTLSIIFCKK